MQLKHFESIANVHHDVQLIDNAGVSEADMAGEVGDGMPRRVPLMQRGLTKQQWAALQHKKATKPARKPLCLQYPPGRLTPGPEDTTHQQWFEAYSFCCTPFGQICLVLVMFGLVFKMQKIMQVTA